MAERAGKLAVWLLLISAVHIASEKSPPLDPRTRASVTFFSGIHQGSERWAAVGSSPPSCRRKCGGCAPCAAVQIPAAARPARVDYANYVPEGWKCQCGSSFYNP
ncbi:EPIDERMAL PATTERNING FACTOR-like protein 4 [Wolffia australiana]